MEPFDLSNIDENVEFLYLSDDKVFYTVEGEGRYIGYPSVFMRTSICNLTCMGWASPASPYGCDSHISWRVKNKLTFKEAADFMESKGFHENLRAGAIFKLTGGEPFLWQEKLARFIRYIIKRWDFEDWAGPVEFSTSKDEKPTLYVDFETNGTIMPNPVWEFDVGCDVTYTTSPKLSNNGDPVEKRYKPDVLRYLVEQDACFKFVANQESDLEEVFEKYVNDEVIKLPTELIWIMPMCGSRKELTEIGATVADICKKHNLKFSNRLHLQLWDQALRV